MPKKQKSDCKYFEKKPTQCGIFSNRQNLQKKVFLMQSSSLRIAKVKDYQSLLYVVDRTK